MGRLDSEGENNIFPQKVSSQKDCPNIAKKILLAAQSDAEEGSPGKTYAATREARLFAEVFSCFGTDKTGQGRRKEDNISG
jgi:hypothetical protein